ncbi:hypothetical protein [Nocardia nova]|uniref:hypothetical protein n=1 Tax=Nocardia nova TaxID=37330 RepID=UPI0033E73188
MFRLRRLYFDSIGVPENRFSDLLIDLTDIEGDPTDTIVWLRNGAGKTTMLSLLLALILPDRREFLATRTKNRTLEDLILGSDTAHVVAEWTDPEGQLLLTGAVYEWEGRTRPHDHNGRGKERLHRSWWCVHPDPTVTGATLSDLPFTLRSGGVYDRDRFCAHIRNLTVSGVNAVVASSTINEWHAALRERRFDPELFRYFTEVNAAEGGMDGLFNDIDSPGRFVRYLLRFVGDHQRVQPVRDLLADTAVEIAKRPIYTAQRRFCTDSIPRVSAFGEAHRQWVLAAEARNRIVQRAAELKCALLEAAAVSQERCNLSTERADTLDGRIKDVRGRIDSTRNLRNEYLFVAAEFDVADAQQAANDAKLEADDAESEIKAWAAVELYAELQQRKAEQEACRTTLENAAQQARPLVDQYAAARSVLAAAITSEVEKVRHALAEMQERKEIAEAEKDDADEHRDQAVQRISELQAEATQLRESLSRHEENLRKMLAEGLIRSDERLADAEQRLLSAQTTAQTTTEQLQSRRDGLTPDMESADEDAARARARTSQARTKSDELAAELKPLQRRAAELAESRRLRLLLQTDQVDVENSADEAVDMLARAITATDKELLALGEERARGERAVHSLTEFHLLPPRLAVEKAIDVLEHNAITAVSGWRYLAENVEPMQHQRYTAELPEVLDGLIVYGDAEQIAAAAHVIGTSEELIVISSAMVFADRRAPRVVVGPAAAQHDKAAGADELQHRTARSQSLYQRIDELNAQRDDDLASKSAITAWQNDLPPDGIGGLRTRVTEAQDVLSTMKAHQVTAEQRLEELHGIAAQLDSQILELQIQLGRLEGVIPRVQNAAQTERDYAEPGKIRLTTIPREIEHARSDKDSWIQRRKSAADQIATLDATHRFHTRRRADLETELEGLPAPAQRSDLSIDAARAALAVTEQQLRENFPEDSLRQALQTADREVQRAARAWNTNADNVRHLAIALASSHQAADHASRAEASADAATRSSRAQAAYGIATERLRGAQARRTTALSTRPTTPVEIQPAPDREQAILLSDIQAREMAELEVERHRLEADRAAAAAEAATAKNRCDTLNDQTTLLRGIEPSHTSTTFVPDDSDQVRAMTQSMMDALTTADAGLDETERTRTDRADELSQWAGDDEFVTVAEDEHGAAVRQLRDMFRDKTRRERIAGNAEDLVDELATREKAIALQLGQVEKHKDNVVVRMIDLVDDALSVITRASALSELPAGIGPWEHRRFLTVEARSKPSREQIGLRVGELIDTMVQGRRIETDTAELLWRATEVSVPDGFRATVLKPAPDQPTGRTPVEDMRKWSGGENLTASLVLFCVLARLRAERRTGNRNGTAGGVLPLDNPVGKANYLPFLDLQRRVARACGVQLVFWTGLGDLGAVTTFPRIAALHKRPSASRPGRAYVQPDAENSQLLDIVSAVRDDS